jgi:hypothetical protein
LLGLTVNFLMTRGARRSLPPMSNVPAFSPPIYRFNFQHQEVFQFDTSRLSQFFRPDFNERFKHFLYGVIAEAGAPPYLRNGLIFVE